MVNVGFSFFLTGAHEMIANQTVTFASAGYNMGRVPFDIYSAGINGDGRPCEVLLNFDGPATVLCGGLGGAGQPSFKR